ncbi:MAG: 8-oxo-dGTP diphosphatase [Lachnospiraceae bacterium]|nr:8-oxo-dGTP diphosphatase [Lachnospiraceae bacterium]
MILSTTCYIQKDGKTLMLYRNKKKNDINKNKWIGLGGKFETGESPEQCLVREIKEEVGVTLTEFKLRGVLTFLTTEILDNPYYVFVYTATEFIGEIGVCDEGTLEWVDTDKIVDLELWEGDRLFWKWVKEEQFFSAYFKYEADVLVEQAVTFY